MSVFKKVVNPPFVRYIVRKIHVSNSLCRLLDTSPNACLDKNIYDRYMSLPQPDDKIQIKYIWIDGTGEHLRSKSKTVDFVPESHKDIPKWTYDGSSTFQASGAISDTYLVPVAMYNDPFRRGNNKLVLCETYDLDNKPKPTNHRVKAVEILSGHVDEEPMFGFEQEYQMMDAGTKTPFGWPSGGEPQPTGLYYCGVGANTAFGREISECVYRSSLYCGIDLFGSNAEVTPAQWELQTGPTIGIKAADDLWMLRFLLDRIAEDFGVYISLHPKLYPHWNGAGCHANFSTKAMREDGGMKVIEEAIKKLSKTHKEHIAAYDPKGGEYNKLRLTGRHETSSMTKFSWAIANRGASVRINKCVVDKKKGYLEDRRPASNVDPYLCVYHLMKSILGEKCP